MKKLITMIAAGAMAFGLYAESGFISGTTFNGLSGTFDGTGDTATWSGFAADNQNKISTTASGALDAARPDYWVTAAEATAENLAVKTALDAPIYRNINGEGTAAELGTYFDALVKFTAFDIEDTATLPNDGKIGVWMKETATGTNLFVTAGVKTADGVTPTNFDCGDFTAKGEDWFRLTVKTMNVGNNNIGFVIFVDGVAVTCNAAKTSFGSIELTTQAQIWNKTGALFLAAVSGTFSQVGFAGTGWVDDIVFTRDQPKKDNVEFAADKAAYTIEWDVDHMADVVIAGVTLSDAEKAAGFAVVEGAAPTSLTISWTGKNGKASGSNVAMTKNDNAFTAPTLVDAEAEFGGKPYTLAEAINKANAAETAGTLKLLTDKAENITINKAGTTLDLNGWTLTGEVTGDIVLDNTGATVATVAGAYYATGSIAKSTIKFAYDVNLGEGTECAITAELPAGKVFDKDGDYWVLADAVAEIVGGAKFATLGAAVAAVQEDGQTVKLLGNYTAVTDPVEKIYFTKNATLDLGGFTLTVPGPCQGVGIFGVAEGATNTVQNGTIIAKGNGSRCYQVQGALISTANWTKDVENTPDAQTATGIVHQPIFDIFNGSVTINGGTITNQYGDVFRGKDEYTTKSITINGGSISGYEVFYMYKGGTVANIAITAGELATTGTKIFNIFLDEKDTTKVFPRVNCLLTDACTAKFGETTTVEPYLASDCELVKEETSDWYVIQKKQATDPIPEIDPTQPGADEAIAAVFADATDKALATEITAENYTEFRTWAQKFDADPAISEGLVLKSAHAADSFLLGQETLLENAPVAEIETIAKEGDNVTLTFAIKDGDDPITVAQTAADYVKTLVQCAEDVGFTNKLDADVTVTISETTLTATVELPENKAAAFMKIAK